MAVKNKSVIATGNEKPHNLVPSVVIARQIKHMGVMILDEYGRGSNVPNETVSNGSFDPRDAPLPGLGAFFGVRFKQQ